MNFIECQLYVKSLTTLLDIELEDILICKIAQNFINHCMISFRSGADSIYEKRYQNNGSGFLILRDLEDELSNFYNEVTPELLMLIGIPSFFLLESLIQNVDLDSHTILEYYCKNCFQLKEYIDQEEICGLLVVSINLKELFCHLIANLIDDKEKTVEIYNEIIWGKLNIDLVPNYKSRAKSKLTYTEDTLSSKRVERPVNYSIKKSVTLRLQLLRLSP